MQDLDLYRAVLDGRDCLELIKQDGRIHHHAVGCAALLEIVHRYRTDHGDDVKTWPLPEGDSHEVLLLREFILRLRGEWRLPYQATEVCHCRMVSTHDVDQAVIAGAHTVESVSRATSACTACGTCRPDIEKIIAYRLGKPA